MSVPGRLCVLLLLLSLAAPGTARAGADDALPEHAPRQVEGAPAASKLPLLMSSVGLGLAGALVGGLAGAGVGVVQDLNECIVWCNNTESHVPLSTFLGAATGAVLGVVLAVELQPDPAPTALAKRGEALVLVPLVPLGGAGPGVGLSGRF